MSLEQIVVKVNNEKDLKNGAERTLRTASANLVGPNSKDLDDSADLFSFTRNENSLGLKRKEAYGLFSALTEISLNIAPGLGVPSDKYDDKEAAKIVDRALAMAKESSPDLTASFGIEFDPEKGLGRIFASHPIVPQFSPINFNLQEARIKRRTDQRGPLGGIENIESGVIHERITDAGLTHSEVKTEDINTLHGLRERKIWVEFSRK
jgi:hypothetical protein